MPALFGKSLGTVNGLIQYDSEFPKAAMRSSQLEAINGRNAVYFVKRSGKPPLLWNFDEVKEYFDAREKKKTTPDESRSCVSCGSALMEGSRKDMVYCSRKCKESAKQKRQSKKKATGEE